MRRGGDVSLARFSFVSYLRDGLPEAALCRLARSASERNRRLGLTGELVFADGVFRQVIEGTCDAVITVASDILADARHGRIEVRGFGAADRREYAEWRVVGLDDSARFCSLRSVTERPARARAAVRGFRSPSDGYAAAEPAADRRA